MSSDLEPTASSYFDRAYRNYDAQNPPRKLDHYLDTIEARMGQQPASLLDVGCGMGAFLERAHARFPDWRLHGLEPELDGVNATSQRVPSAVIKRGSATSIPFESNTFEVVTAWDVLEHIPELDNALGSIRSVLKPGGLLAAVVPVYDGITGPLIRLMDKDPTHVHKMPRDFWIDRLSDDYENLRWHGINRYLLTKIYVHVPTRRLRRQAAAIFLSGKLRD